MAKAAMRAAAPRHQITPPSADATAVPTRTGTTAAGSVRGRAPCTQRLVAIPRSMAGGKLPAVPRLVPLDASGSAAFVTSLRRAWDEGDAVFPVDPRLPSPAREALLQAVGAG